MKHFIKSVFGSVVLGLAVCAMPYAAQAKTTSAKDLCGLMLKHGFYEAYWNERSGGCQSEYTVQKPTDAQRLFSIKYFVYRGPGTKDNKLEAISLVGKSGHRSVDRALRQQLANSSEQLLRELGLLVSPQIKDSILKAKDFGERQGDWNIEISAKDPELLRFKVWWEGAGTGPTLTK